MDFAKFLSERLIKPKTHKPNQDSGYYSQPPSPKENNNIKLFTPAFEGISQNTGLSQISVNSQDSLYFQPRPNIPYIGSNLAQAAVKEIISLCVHFKNKYLWADMFVDSDGDLSAEITDLSQIHTCTPCTKPHIQQPQDVTFGAGKTVQLSQVDGILYLVQADGSRVPTDYHLVHN